jgi:hypothetical protein
VLEYYFGNVTLEQILHGTADGPASLEDLGVSEN